MQISNGELGAGDVDWQVDLAAAREVLDIAVSAMLWTTRNRTSSLFADLLFDASIAGTCVNVDRLWWLCDVSVHVGTSGDQLSFTLVPCLEDFLAGSAA